VKLILGTFLSLTIGLALSWKSLFGAIFMQFSVFSQVKQAGKHLILNN